MYTLAFQATGCPNPDPMNTIGFNCPQWDRTYGIDDRILSDMLAYCVLTRDNTADERQRKHCCGSNDCTIEKCINQKKFADGMYYSLYQVEL